MQPGIAGSVKSWPASPGITCPDFSFAEESYLNRQLFPGPDMAGYTVNYASLASRIKSTRI